MIRTPRRKLNNEEIGQGGLPWNNDIYARLASNRVIFLAEDISKETGSSLSAMLLYYDADNHDDITIYINCNGGDATALSNIYDVMQMIHSPVQTICIGKAYSAAAVLLAAGTAGKRFMTKHADVMIHGLQVQYPLTESAGQIDSEIEYRILKNHNTMLMKILARHTEKDYRQIEKDCQRDYFMTSGDAMKYGMIDGIL